MLNTPVLFLMFNRPETAQIVFQQIRKAEPSRLFVAADGPRNNRPLESRLCRESRAIIEQVDWDCDIKTLFRIENLGCKYAVSSAIDWFFSHVDQGIILEDDCVPDQSFFPFCDELLERYHDDKRIMMITGGNYQFGKTSVDTSYYFSRYFHVWGWATWKRAWQQYDVDIKAWPKARFADILPPDHVKFWSRIFDDVYAGNVDTWDFQWVLSCWLQNGLSIIPSVNMISNIGFDGGGTHLGKRDMRANMGTEPTKFPLKHPYHIIRNAEADRFAERTEYSRFGFFHRMVHRILENSKFS